MAVSGLASTASAPKLSGLPWLGCEALRTMFSSTVPPFTVAPPPMTSSSGPQEAAIPLGVVELLAVESET